MPALRARSSRNFGPRRRKGLLKHPDGLPALFPALVPLEVVAAFGMVFVLAVYQDVVPDDSSIALDDGGKGPPAVDFDHLDDVDAVCIGLRSCHCLSPPWGGQVARVATSIKCGVGTSSKGGK